MGNYPIIQAGYNTKGKPVSAQTVASILELTNKTSPEAIQYATDSIIAYHKRTGSPVENLEMIEKISIHSERVQKARDIVRSAWLEGWEDKNDTESFNEVIVNELREQGLPDNMGEVINMFYTMDDMSQFLRVYLLENEDLVDENRANVLDTYWNLWLTQNKMIGQDGVIYRADEHGENTKNERVPASELKEKMPGLEDYLRSSQLNVTVRQYQEAAPTETPSAETSFG